MTAAPLNNSLAKVRARLPLHIDAVRDPDASFIVRDKHNRVFCLVPCVAGGQAAAELIRDTMNEMA